MFVPNVASLKTTRAVWSDKHRILAGGVKIRRVENVAEGSLRIEILNSARHIPFEPLDLPEADVPQLRIDVRNNLHCPGPRIDRHDMSRLHGGFPQADQAICSHRTTSEHIPRAN